MTAAVTAGFVFAAGTAAPGGDLRICAPELLQGGRASISSDVYSAACTLYALVTGQLPFAGITQQSDLVDAIVQAKYPAVRDLAPHVSQALADKIGTGMALNPADRFLSAAAFDTALALPQRARRFTPHQQHAGHQRCFAITGTGSDIQVCVLPSATAKRVPVETRHQSTGNRILRHCFETTERDLAKRLRAIFNDLR